jgi:hypothetical protein
MGPLHFGLSFAFFNFGGYAHELSGPGGHGAPRDACGITGRLSCKLERLR